MTHIQKTRRTTMTVTTAKRIELLKNIAEAMDVSKRSYDKIKKQKSKRVTTGL
jgi:hypothetical protein